MIAYKVYADQTLILDTVNEVNDGLISAQLSLELNEAGSFDFTLLRTHPQKSNITPYKTIIAVEMIYIDETNTIQDDYIPFLGRVTSIDEDMYGNTSYQCEGAMAFLNDIYVNKKLANQITVHTYLGRLFIDYRSIITSGMGQNYYDENKLISFISGEGSDASWTYGRDIEESGEEAPKDEYRSLLEIIKNDVIDKIGGIYYLVHGKTQNGYYTDSTYYNADDSMGLTFNYDTQSGHLPSIQGIFVINRIPHFDFNINIIDLSSSPIKTGIWTGIMPVGKDGLLLADMADPTMIGNIVLWDDRMANRYGQIVKCIEFSEADTGSKLDSFAREYLRRFLSTDWYSMNNYTVKAVEPCLVSENFNKLVKIGYPVYIQLEAPNEILLNCLSIKHNLFNVQDSQYVLGPVVPDNIINEDISTWK